MTPPLGSEDLPTKSDLEEMVAATDNLRTEALILFEFETGLRLPELVNMEIAHLTLGARKRIFVVTVPGLKANHRTVCVFERCGPVKRWLGVHPASGRAESALWTQKDDSHPLSQSTIQRIFTRVATQAGIKKRVTPRGVRKA